VGRAAGRSRLGVAASLARLLRKLGWVDLIDRVLGTIRQHRMLTGGETVVVAVSGGADSVALLHVLVRLPPAFALALHVAHVDHRLRADSSEDAIFVRDLGARLGLAVDVAVVDVPRSGSPEDAARRARYAALGAIADRVGATRIATAHTADDQAETVVMRLVQGAGPRGLAGIPPVRGRVIRPFIDARRSDIVAFLRGEGIGWREDPSNADPRFLRNRIRRDLMPAVAHENPAIVDALTRTAGLMREALEIAERLAARELRRGIVEPDGVTLSRDRLRGLPPSVAVEVLRQAAVNLGAAAPFRAWAHRGLARALAEPAPRRAIRIGGVRLEVSGGHVRIARGARASVVERPLVVPGVTPMPEVGLALDARVLERDRYDVPRTPEAVAFDAETLPGPLAVRARRSGDRFAPFGGPARKLKDLLIAAKVPRWARDALPIVEAGRELVWVAGVRRGEAAPVTPGTRRVVELRLRALADDRDAR
jgi:tRNA(Ile)-lysidine synthase